MRDEIYEICRYIIEEAIKIALEDQKTLKKIAVDVRNEADDKGDFELVALMEDECAQYSKRIWFIESMLKA